MSFIEDVFKGNLGTGLAVGLAVTILGPVVIPVVARMAKPVAKAVIKAGVRVYECGMETGSSAAHSLEGLFAEARSEIEEERKTRERQTQADWHTPPPCRPGAVPESPL